MAGARAEDPHFDVSPNILAFVARAIRSNGRDLEGAVNRLRAHFTPTGPALTVETAETAIRDLIRTHELKRVKIEDIQKLVASHYSVSRADILSSRRTAAVVKPRQVAMFLAKNSSPCARCRKLADGSAAVTTQRCCMRCARLRRCRTPIRSCVKSLSF